MKKITELDILQATQVLSKAYEDMDYVPSKEKPLLWKAGSILTSVLAEFEIKNGHVDFGKHVDQVLIIQQAVKNYKQFGTLT